MSVDVLSANGSAAAPQPVHNCPSCSHWLPEGTLACPECQTLTYGEHLSGLAVQAQQMEQAGRWKEAREQWAATLEWLPGNTRQAESIAHHLAEIDARLQAEQNTQARWKKRLGPLAPVALFLMKAKSALFLLFKLKFLISFFAFFAIYWALFGWKFAAGFIVCLLLHEMGHFVAVKRRGLPVEMPVFLPGMGAYVRWYGQGVSRRDLAMISLAGPVWGLGAALACAGMFAWTHAQIWLVLTYVGAWINFLNLLPVLGLDGAQASYALSRMQRGLLAATCLIFFALTITGGELFGKTTEWVFLIVGLAMGWRAFAADAPQEPDTRVFVVFQALALVLGAIVVRTQFAGM